MTAVLLDGKQLAQTMQAEIAAETAELVRSHGLRPGLAAESVAAGFHPAAASAGASAPAHRVARASAALPAANFVVEWRLQPADARPAGNGSPGLPDLPGRPVSRSCCATGRHCLSMAATPCRLPRRSTPSYSKPVISSMNRRPAG